MKNNERSSKPRILSINNNGTARNPGLGKKRRSVERDDNYPRKRTARYKVKPGISDTPKGKERSFSGTSDKIKPDFSGTKKSVKKGMNVRKGDIKSSRNARYGKVNPLKKGMTDSDEVRLNRFLAHAGICSRREADELIKAGLITVNGEVIKEMGTRVRPADVVKYNGETIRSERKVYILLNKPKDFVTSLDDEKQRKTVMDLIRNACPERIYPVGRLDRNTTGVMLLTNDGELSAKLTHPRYNKKKVYHVFLDKNLKQQDLQAIAKGITLEDGPIAPDAISYVDKARRSEIGIEIHSGRNRIVKRIFEYFGYHVIKLDRVYFAGLTKKNLPRGKWRFLTDKEINTLKMNAYE